MMKLTVRRVRELCTQRAPRGPDGIRVYSGPRRRKYKLPYGAPVSFPSCLSWEVVGVADDHPERAARYAKWESGRSARWDAIPFDIVRSKRKEVTPLRFVRAQWPPDRKLGYQELTEYYGWIYIQRPISAVEEIARSVDPDIILRRIDAYLEEVNKWLSSEFFRLYYSDSDGTGVNIANIWGYGFTESEVQAIENRYKQCHARGDRLTVTSFSYGVHLWVPKDMEVDIQPVEHRGSSTSTCKIAITGREQWSEIMAYNPEMVEVTELMISQVPEFIYTYTQ